MPVGGQKTLVLILALLASVIVWQRTRLRDAALQGDICAYAVIGHEMMHGRQLYSDLWERKPPALYATYAVAECFAGYGPTQIYVLGLSFSLGTLILICLIGTSGNHGHAGGIIAALLWTLLNTDLQTTANQPNPEIFINFWICGAVLLMLRWPANAWAPMALGLLLSMATLYKHNSALAAGGLLLGFFLCSKREHLLRRFFECITAGIVICAVWGGMAAYFTANHRLDDFMDVLFRQNFAYSRGVSGNFAKALTARRLLPACMFWSLGPLALVMTLLLGNLLRHRLKACPEWIILLAWSGGTFATVAVTGYLSPIYYLLWLPIGCIDGSWAGASLIAKSSAVPRAIAWLVVILALGFLIVRQGREFLLTDSQWITEQFPNYSLAEQNHLGTAIGRLLKPNECFWDFGDDNALYFFSRHSPPSGLLFIDPYLYGGRTREYWSRLMRDLQTHQPSLVVMSDNYTMLFPPDAPIFAWLARNYLVWNTPLGFGYHHLLVRRDCDLANRLGIKPSPTNSNDRSASATDHAPGG